MRKKVCVSRKIMTFIAILILVITLSVVLSTSLLNTITSYQSKADAPNSPQKIYGGTEAAEGRWPFIVGIFYDFKSYKSGNSSPYGRVNCAGTLIAPRWVLTAAHCADAQDSIFVSGGNLQKPGRTYKIANVYLYDYMGQKYDPNSEDYLYDVALLQLSEDVKDIDNNPVETISILENDSLLSEGKAGMALGWGMTNRSLIEEIFQSKPIDPIRLQQAVIPILASTRANQPNWTNGEVKVSQVAAGYPKGGIDICYGDSGGPILIYDGAKWIQAGVISHLPGIKKCGIKNKPSIYTRLSYAGVENGKKVNFRQWIIDTTTGANDKASLAGTYLGTAPTSSDTIDYNKRVCDPKEWGKEPLPAMCSELSRGRR